ncbi:MAG: PIN domain-containing protein [Candidatus Bathyarchaeia archaeon]
MTSFKAYLDTSVLVAYGLGSDDIHYKGAKTVINDILQGNYIGVVSLLALLETMDVIRKRIVDKTPKDILDGKSDTQKKEYVQQESRKRYQELIDKLTKAAKAKKILLVEHDGTNIADVLVTCHNMLTKEFGDIKLYHRCLQCGSDHEHYSYKGIGPIDAMHFVLAKKVPCQIFITTDKSFASLNGEIHVSII